MPDQFENPEATKLEDETTSDAAATKRIERVAEKDATHKGTDGTPMKLKIWASCPPSEFVQYELIKNISGALVQCGQKAAAKRG